MIPGDLLSAHPHRQFHTLPGLLDRWAALSNSYPNACMPMQGGNLYHFYDGLWFDPAKPTTYLVRGGHASHLANPTQSIYTVFDLITAPAFITTPPPLTFYLIFTYRPLDDLFPDFLLYFHLLSPTWRSFGTSGREQIYVSAPVTY